MSQISISELLTESLYSPYRGEKLNLNFSSFLGFVLTHVNSENLYGHDVAGPRDVTCRHMVVKSLLLFDAQTGGL